MAISADLGEKLEAVVNDLVANGRYGSKSEVLREGVRLVQEREAALAELYAAVDRGIAAAERGDVRPLDEFAEELIAELEAEEAKRDNAA
jgi:antitoxin ParD1/3/4